MSEQAVYNQLLQKYRSWFKREPAVAAYAPGRIEVIGNHTDYNEGFVCSAAINCGTWFVAARRSDKECRLVAGDLMVEADFCTCCPNPLAGEAWANYVAGVLAGLGERGQLRFGFDAMFFGNVPLGAGLSSSAALEMSAGLALSKLYDINVDRLTMARIGQTAEHDFVGVKCGLLDQITSLYGVAGQLVETDFRTLAVKTIPLDPAVVFLMCNTHVKHALVDGEYNERRAACEEASAYFAKVLSHPVKALRDVSMAEWEAHRCGLPEVVARRAAHPISENERVLAAAAALRSNDTAEFGRLMFASHESSRTNFENSTPELDYLVATARRVPGVLGARLSGGGFGGSVVVLVETRSSETAAAALANAYATEYGKPCDVTLVKPSAGARVAGG